jgi:hypothetical protein
MNFQAYVRFLIAKSAYLFTIEGFEQDFIYNSISIIKPSNIYLIDGS